MEDETMCKQLYLGAPPHRISMFTCCLRPSLLCACMPSSCEAVCFLSLCVHQAPTNHGKQLLVYTCLLIISLPCAYARKLENLTHKIWLHCCWRGSLVHLSIVACILYELSIGDVARQACHIDSVVSRCQHTCIDLGCSCCLQHHYQHISPCPYWKSSQIRIDAQVGWAEVLGIGVWCLRHMRRLLGAMLAVATPITMHSKHCCTEQCCAARWRHVVTEQCHET